MLSNVWIMEDRKMKFAGAILFSLLVLILISGSAFGWGNYLTTFNNTYPGSQSGNNACLEPRSVVNRLPPSSTGPTSSASRSDMTSAGGSCLSRTRCTGRQSESRQVERQHRPEFPNDCTRSGGSLNPESAVLRPITVFARDERRTRHGQPS